MHELQCWLVVVSDHVNKLDDMQQLQRWHVVIFGDGNIVIVLHQLFARDMVVVCWGDICEYV